MPTIWPQHFSGVMDPTLTYNTYVEHTSLKPCFLAAKHKHNMLTLYIVLYKNIRYDLMSYTKQLYFCHWSCIFFYTNYTGYIQLSSYIRQPN